MPIKVNVKFYNTKDVNTSFVAKVTYDSVSQVFNLLMKDYEYHCCELNYKNELAGDLTIGALRTLQEKLKQHKRIRVWFNGERDGFIKGKRINAIDISYAYLH